VERILAELQHTTQRPQNTLRPFRNSRRRRQRSLDRDGIPLVGIDIDTKEGRQTIGIVFEHFRHSIKNVSTIAEVSGENVAAGLDIQDSEGKTTALRFEDYVVESED
jgi:hypothetical protein